MGEANRRKILLRERLLEQVDGWTFPPSPWERALVTEVAVLPAFRARRMPAKDLEWMRMPANHCHANTRWYEANDWTHRSKAVVGWWIQGADLILHSVLTNGHEYMCITPSSPGETEIIFIPDPKIEWIESDGQLAAKRNGQIIGLGIRRYPELTIAMHETMRVRLEQGMDPDRASEFSHEEREDMMRTYLSPEEFAAIGKPGPV
ncbi:hypothetical protein ATE68_06745 [Sphingopyxis sp. H038]|uniref:hypothetical protein n=1 Tax=unclassified Sphingopyxis TaxID=2614943 RepID=UPI0007310F13|nr:MULTISPECIES: hypothetical protein [unclassified Sphingopyxis]KTE02517.1 hypothetical protein ATE78_09285 [Sphingopyxis sp. H012]KTE06771.1 hypothetical protein ATE76_18475 [Sphingopyxis sp. H093]KTE11078.1 hypothetical protein ATE70_08985 [Sphingopyxis sp. H053]KTE30562.1 hypothetical protein ATE75_02390 [Sphingopyxis sp. H080]KTE35566.1 hypothetical protein ATE68_06745 [Sphingopyxis sp. H038]